MYENYIDRERNVESMRIAFTSWEKILIVLLFLSCLNFYNYGLHIIVPLFAVFCVQQKRVSVSMGIVPLLLLSVSILVFWEDSLSGPSNMVKWLAWPLAYIVGYGIAIPKGKDAAARYDAEKKSLIYIAVCAVGFFLHFILNMWISLGNNRLGRNVLDFWTGEIRAATGHALLACVPLGFSIANLFCKSSAKQKIWSIAVLLAILYFNLTISTRTLFLMALLIAFIALIYMMWGSGNQHRIKTLLIVVLVSCVAIVLYDYNVFGIRETIESSGFYDRFFGGSEQEITDDSRWNRKIKYLSFAPYYLWGGGHIHQLVGGYAHDLFLDTYDEAGVFALIAVIMLVWSSAVKLIQLSKSDQVDARLRMSLLCIYVGLYQEFMIEPIFAGAPDLLLAFCFFHGMVSRLLINVRSVKGRNDSLSEYL